MSWAVARFGAYGVSHWVALAVFAAGCVALVLIGRSQRGTAEARGFGKALTLTAVLVVIATQAYALLPGEFNLKYSLPLQLCDLAWMTAVYALWTHRRWAVSLTYYWGLTLTTQAILTPDLAAEFPDPVFLLFWAMHLLVVWAAVHLTWGVGLTPDWRSYRTALLVTAGWAAAMLGFNALAGTNYGYLNAKPPSASILDLLGPWPWYVVVEIVVIVTAWALVTWPWVALGRTRPA